MNIIERCIRLPVTVTVIVMLIFIFGIIGLLSVPVQLTPNVDQPVLTVTTRWFGASPQEIVTEIIEEQEDVLKTVSGLREMTAQAVEGEASIRLEFAVGVNKDSALIEVQDKLRQVPDYPEDVDEPVVERSDRFSRDYIAWFIVRLDPNFKPEGPVAPGFEHREIPKLQTFFEEFVKPVLERAEGVSEVQVLGGREREAQVRVDLAALASRGISVSQLAAALRSENLDVTAGTIDEGKRRTSIRVLGQYVSPKQIEDTVIAYTSAGTPVYVRDVGEVTLDFKKEVGFVRSLGAPVLAINAQREAGSNVLVVMDNLKAALKTVNEEILKPKNWGVYVEQVYDQTVYIGDSVATARNNLLLGAALAAVVLLLTLRSVGATLVILVAIPISVVGTFLGMSLLGRSLNVISMAGLTFAVGMGIDNAIVVLENIFRHREMGKGRIKAAVDGASEVFGAVIASTLTNVAVFLPVIFIEEEAGQLFRDLGIALTISFFLYLFVAPTVIPMLTTLFLRHVPTAMRSDETRTSRATGFIGRWQRRLSTRFYEIVHYLTGGLLRRLVLVVALVVVSVLATRQLIPPTDYLPTGNQNLIFGFVLPPPGYNPDENRAIAARVENYLRPWWEAHDDPSKLPQLQADFMRQVKVQAEQLEENINAQRQAMTAQGMPADAIESALTPMVSQLQAFQSATPPPAIRQFFFVTFGASAFMGAISDDPANVTPLITLMNQSVAGIPGTFGIFQQASIFRDTSPGGVLELSLYGPDTDAVLNASGAMMGALIQSFNTYPRSDPSNFNLGRDETQVIVDRVRAASAQVGGIAGIRETLQAAVDGLVIGDYRDVGQTIDLTIRSIQPLDERRSDELAMLPLATRNGQVVPLSSVASLLRTTAPQQINRTEEQTSVSFTVNLPPGLSLEQAVDTLENNIIPGLRQAGVMPPSLSYKLEGSAGKLADFRNAFLPGLLLAILITYLLLAALYENFIHPITIMLSVPFAMAGGLAALGIMHSFVPIVKLDVLTMLGFVILVGTIINNPILIVHQALNFIRSGMDEREAVARSTQTRVRPIFMSVITTVAGLAPLVVIGGSGSELYRGLGTVLLGGLIVSTLFTLILTPTFMSLVLDFLSLTRRLFLGKPKPAVAALDGDSVPSPALASPRDSDAKMTP